MRQIAYDGFQKPHRWLFPLLNMMVAVVAVLVLIAALVLIWIWLNWIGEVIAGSVVGGAL